MLLISHAFLQASFNCISLVNRWKIQLLVSCWTLLVVYTIPSNGLSTKTHPPSRVHPQRTPMSIDSGKKRTHFQARRSQSSHICHPGNRVDWMAFVCGAETMERKCIRVLFECGRTRRKHFRDKKCDPYGRVNAETACADAENLCAGAC